MLKVMFCLNVVGISIKAWPNPNFFDKICSNLIWFLTLILVSYTSDSFSIQNSLEERKSCSFMM